MIAKLFPYFYQFSATKHMVYKGRYLIPVAPKRPVSSYLIYSNEARQKMSKNENQKLNVTQSSKIIGSQWKNLSPEQKAKYDQKASQLRSKYQKQIDQYNSKYVEPFKNVNYNNLLMKQFYSKNKVSSITEGALALKKYRESLSQQQLQKYKKMAQDINKQNEKIKNLYEIPTLKYKNFNSYLRSTKKKQNEKDDNKSQMDEKTRKKLQENYQKQRNAFNSKLKDFAKSFHMKYDQLVKLINKEKQPHQKLAEQNRNLKQTEKKQISNLDEKISVLQEKLKVQKQKLKSKAQKTFKKDTSKIQKQLQKIKNLKARVKSRYGSKKSEVMRKKNENILVEKLKKSKNQQEPQAKRSRKQKEKKNVEKNSQSKIEKNSSKQDNKQVKSEN